MEPSVVHIDPPKAAGHYGLFQGVAATPLGQSLTDQRRSFSLMDFLFSVNGLMDNPAAFAEPWHHAYLTDMAPKSTTVAMFPNTLT